MPDDVVEATIRLGFKQFGIEGTEEVILKQPDTIYKEISLLAYKNIIARYKEGK